MSDTNFANRNKFKFLVHFPDTREFEFFAKAVTFGGINLGKMTIQTPFRQVEYPGDSFIAEDAVIDFFIDEHWEAYKEIFAWMKAIKNRTSGNVDPLLFSTMTLTILNTKYRDSFSIEMRDCWPFSLTTLMMDTDDDTSPLMGQVLMTVGDYEIIEKN
jgi:hypothetical protein